MRPITLILLISLAAFAQAPPPGPPRKPRGSGLLSQAGAADKHIIDDAAAERGKKVYIQECITCHGPTARGSQGGPDIVRSLVVLKDRYGSTIGPFLRKGHPTQTAGAAARFTDPQIQDIADFLHLKVEETLRISPNFHAQNVLTGNPEAGKAFFNGAGKCAGCHSVTADLKGIGGKYDAIDLQQRFIFPMTARNAKPRTVTVTPLSGPALSGRINQIDDFNVSLYDASGEYHTFKRSPALKVKIDNPYAAHEQMLDSITDQQIHDMTAYLETLK